MTKLSTESPRCSSLWYRTNMIVNHFPATSHGVSVHSRLIVRAGVIQSVLKDMSRARKVAAVREDLRADYLRDDFRKRGGGHRGQNQAYMGIADMMKVSESSAQIRGISQIPEQDAPVGHGSLLSGRTAGLCTVDSGRAGTCRSAFRCTSVTDRRNIRCSHCCA